MFKFLFIFIYFLFTVCAVRVIGECELLQEFLAAPDMENVNLEFYYN